MPFCKVTHSELLRFLSEVFVFRLREYIYDASSPFQIIQDELAAIRDEAGDEKRNIYLGAHYTWMQRRE